MDAFDNLAVYAFFAALTKNITDKNERAALKQLMDFVYTQGYTDGYDKGRDDGYTKGYVEATCTEIERGKPDA